MHFKVKSSVALCFMLILAASRTSSQPNLTAEPTRAGISAPNTGKIAFISDASGYPNVYIVNSDGSGLKSIGNIERGGYAASPSWSADGRHIAFSVSYDAKSTELVILDVSTGTQDKYTIPDNIDFVYTAISPDAKEVAWASPQPLGVSRVYVVRWKDKKSYLLTDFSSSDTIIRDEHYPHWSPDGKYIAFVSDSMESSEIYLAYPDGSSWTKLVGNVAYSSNFGWAPNSKSIAFIADSGNIYTIGINEKKLQCFDNLKNAYDPDWSPDGNSIVTVAASKENYDLFVLNVVSGKVNQITHRDSLIETPKWSTDNQHITFVNGAIFVVARDGTNLHHLLEQSSTGDTIGSPVWQPYAK
jgi:TolB protein